VWLFWNKNTALSAAYFAFFALATKKAVYGYFTHPRELLSLIAYSYYKRTVPKISDNIPEATRYCFKKLEQTSRSFSLVIFCLNEELKTAICIFYLVLRGLDTVEDDMKPSVRDKIPILKNFWANLKNLDFRLEGFGSNPDEVELLENFHCVNAVFTQLRPEYQQIIEDITKKMGSGMAEFLTKDVLTVADYELYCWYVAGLVGEGLSCLFSASTLEGPDVATSKDLYRAMGLFLQKTNITRDYLDDITQVPPRIFYPKEIWSRYVDHVEDMADPKYRTEAVYCLNEMITDAMSHATKVLNYLSMITEPTIFRFCAIPQVMAIATLQLCYNNKDVFKQKDVKIRRGLTVQMSIKTRSMVDVLDIFERFAKDMEADIPDNDPSGHQLKATLTDLRKHIDATRYLLHPHS